MLEDTISLWRNTSKIFLQQLNIFTEIEKFYHFRVEKIRNCSKRYINNTEIKFSFQALFRNHSIEMKMKMYNIQIFKILLSLSLCQRTFR